MTKGTSDCKKRSSSRDAKTQDDNAGEKSDATDFEGITSLVRLMKECSNDIAFLIHSMP